MSVRVEMKRSAAAESKQAHLARQRALVRNLIEQNGWAPVEAQTAVSFDGASKIVPDNVIPFPLVRKTSQAS